ncbi:unnamed protein product [Symbiodinium sp. CCMP2592]|nr:unnamed protein product [Symbiodinium sp. CCMP2592]
MSAVVFFFRAWNVGLGGAGAVLLLPGRPAEAVPVLRSCGQAFTGSRAGDSARCGTLLGAADQSIRSVHGCSKHTGSLGNATRTYMARST